LRRTRSRRYGMRAFLFCHNVWPLCYVTIPQFCHNAWWCLRNTPEFSAWAYWVRGWALYWCSCAVNACMGRKTEVQKSVNKYFNFFQAIFAPPSKWAHGRCHAIDTPLPWPKVLCMIAHFIMLQKGSITIHSLRFFRCLIRFAEVHQVQGTFIDMATVKNVRMFT